MIYNYHEFDFLMRTERLMHGYKVVRLYSFMVSCVMQYSTYQFNTVEKYFICTFFFFFNEFIFFKKGGIVYG